MEALVGSLIASGGLERRQGICRRGQGALPGGLGRLGRGRSGLNMLIQKACDEVAEPEWWNGAQGAVDEGCE
eukprot:scaffold82029_cov59-Phaeocystis_antarctica.AAC.1